MNKKTFYGISIRGRVAYAIMCFEEYVIAKYPERDFSPVSKIMWNIVSASDSIDISAEKYMEIIPEYLYEFSVYEDADFEYLTKEQFLSLREIIPSDCEDLNVIMHRIYDIAMEHAYAAIDVPAKESINLLVEVIAILQKDSIRLPEMKKVEDFSFEESMGWGKPITPKGLSKILS